MRAETRHEKRMAFRFSDINKVVQNASGWLGLLPLGAALTGGYAYLISYSAWLIKTNWADRIFLAIGLALLTMLVISASLALYRIWRPLRITKEIKADVDSESSNLEDSLLKERLLRARQITELQQRLVSAEQSVADVVKSAENTHQFAVDTVRMLDTIVANAVNPVSQLLKNTIIRIDDSESSFAEFKNKIESWSRTFTDDTDRRFLSVDQGFSAILDRERLISLTEDIDRGAYELSGPTRGEHLGDWHGWQVKEQNWRQKIVSWCQLAATYRFGVSEHVHSTPESLYRGAWDAADILFPNADAIIAWRTFRIILRNFESESELVGRALLMAAFARPSLKSRPTVPRGEDQLLR
jgi:hypothetical protein